MFKSIQVGDELAEVRDYGPSMIARRVKVVAKGRKWFEVDTTGLKYSIENGTSNSRFQGPRMMPIAAYLKESLVEKMLRELSQAGITIQRGTPNRDEVITKTYESLKELCKLPTVEATPVK